MKNIYILPTENSSRLSNNKDGVLELHRLQWRKNTQNIYITSDEEIKNGDYVIVNGLLMFTQDKTEVEINAINQKNNNINKIILTTDPDLIADGIQAITDEFLEWFVKNPSCESIDVVTHYPTIDDEGDNSLSKQYYTLTIPKEEPKQETLEQAANRLFYTVGNEGISSIDSFMKGAKWQAERMYSEEEVLEILCKSHNAEDTSTVSNRLKKWFEQFKKK